MANDAYIDHVSIIFDPVLAKEQMQKKRHVVYGDAVNEPILHKAHINTAAIVVISVGELIPCMAIVDKIKKLNKKPICWREATKLSIWKNYTGWVWIR